MKLLFSQNSPIISFTSKKKKSKKIQIAKQALTELQTHIEQKTTLSETDNVWLRPLIKILGTNKLEINDPNRPQQIITKDCSLSIDKINAHNGIVELKNAILAILSATKYKPTRITLGNIHYTVHNKEIAKLLKAKYDEESLKAIITYLNKQKVFDMSDNTSYGLIVNTNRGIVKTCGADENKDMSERAWITDIMRVGFIQKRKRPETWTKALNTVAQYYYNQNDNFQIYINNPTLYKLGTPQDGIPHIFMPNTLQPDKEWFNNKRLESHGLALKEFSLAIIDGLQKKCQYGYKNNNNIPETILFAMDNLSKYFKAIDYPNAPSAGNWEEIPLEGGLTSDTEAIRSGLKSFRDLLYNNKYSKNKEIQKFRTRFFTNHNPLSQEELDKLIEIGQKRIKKTYLEEAPNIRPHDSSLVFITTSDIKFSNNVYNDVEKHVEILESLEKHLLRENGIIRYAPFNFKLKNGTIVTTPDSYLNLNYFNAIDKNGKLNLDWKNILDQYASKDCSEPELFAARAKLSTPNKEAQWFMVSEISTGYGKQIEKILKFAIKQNRPLNEFENILINKLENKQNEYLNRALARISSQTPNKDLQLKANGRQMPATTVSEAHQYVTDINGTPQMLQGTNAPLAWAISSLYSALHQKAIIIKMQSFYQKNFT